MSDKEENVLPIQGLILSKVERDDNDILFHVEDGRAYVLTHFQDCCEDVSIDSIQGELDSLVGKEILAAHEVISWGEEPEDFCTKTFYTIMTENSIVVIRYYGRSNGYYSERVDHGWVSKENLNSRNYNYFQKV